MRCSIFVVLILFAYVSHAYAQSRRITWDQLGLVYAEARSQMLYRAYIESNGEYVLPLGLSRSQVASDSLLDWIAETIGLREKVPPPVFRGEIHTWEVLSLADQPDGLAQFEDVQWSYLGNNFFTPMDTVDTPEIRAHLEAHFGSPTQTVVEIKQEDRFPRDDYSQFEYWFVVNDSIPMIVMDVGGPFDRGVIVATDHRFRSLLYRMRRSLLGAAIRRSEPVPYVDYYYHRLVEKWYLTGFNGTEYFTREIPEPDLKPGRPDQRLLQGQ